MEEGVSQEGTHCKTDENTNPVILSLDKEMVGQESGQM